MQAEELIQIVKEIQHFQCEFQNIEIKRAEGGCPTRIYDTLSSFSNQDEGGIIIFGLNEMENFEVVGVYDAQDLQQRIGEQCKQMEPEVRPLFTVAEIEGKFLVSAEIPGVDITERPVFYKGAGRLRGSYIRVGESDELMNEYEIYSYDAFRNRVHDDRRVISGAKRDFLDQELIEAYLKEVKNERENVTRNISDEEILELMGVISNGEPTLSGLLSFGKYPQAFLPQVDITAVVIPGSEMGDTGDNGERFMDNKRINGTIPQMLDGALEFVMRNCRTKTIIDETGKRSDKPEYPVIAVREVILNALIHRDYSVHTEGSPITICMFNDRMEVVNKGGLYGRISVDQLGKSRPDTRNTVLVNIMELLHISENRYSGISTIRKEMSKANLPEPEFIDSRGEFKVILRNVMHEDLKNKKSSNVNNTDRIEKVLEFCKKPRSRAEITEYLGLSRYYTMDKIVKPLVESGKLGLSIPEKPRSGKQRYFTISTYEDTET